VKTPPDDLAEKLYGLSDEFLSRGLEVRIDEVAETVGVPRATLYYYFSGRDDLIAFLMTEKTNRMGDQVQKAVAQPGTVVERLAAVIGATVETIADSPSLCVNLLAAIGHGAALGDLLISWEQALFVPLRELLIEGRAAGTLDVVDLDTACAAIGGAIMLSTLRDYIASGEIDAAKVRDVLAHQLVDGLRAA
jgi:TetR/AcrR family transcriptional regulator